jgi:hypothetical protein
MLISFKDLITDRDGKWKERFSSVFSLLLWMIVVSMPFTGEWAPKTMIEGVVEGQG